MKFDLRNGLIWISIQIEYEGENIDIDNCILDTGSATTAVDMDLVEFNYKKPSFVKRLVGIGGGTQEVINQEVNKITIDHKSLENVEIEFGDIQADLGINGFIGTDILRHFDIDIKFSTQEVYLSQVEEYNQI
jgi:hypothetical protein